MNRLDPDLEIVVHDIRFTPYTVSAPGMDAVVFGAQIQSRLLWHLVAHAGYMCPHRELIRAGWPDGTVDDVRGLHNLQAQVCLLRRRVKDLGIQIHPIPGVGYLMVV